ncbi:hypothetical protein FFK22_003395 [Mycobacterium sp. KBS0706]|nr:hypothetical protein FFK22_003395 [Mycobacterium sp. KBS0706]
MSVSELAIDRAAMERLAKAVAFVCGKDHQTAVALKLAAESGSDSDVKKARTLFLKLNPRDRSAALAMIESD